MSSEKKISIEDIKDNLINTYQVRNSFCQKRRFRKFLVENYLNRYENYFQKYGKCFIRGTNVIVGNIEKSSIILTAHYDTPYKLPNNFKSIFYNVLSYVWWIICVCIIYLSFKSMIVFSGVMSFISLVVFLCSCFFLLISLSNKKNANDNTSGVLVLLSIMKKISEMENIKGKEIRDNVCFVFFDQEELGLIGSKAFEKKYEIDNSKTLLINFDCVGDGDTVYFITGENCKEDKKFNEKKFVKEKQNLITYLNNHDIKEISNEPQEDTKERTIIDGLNGFRFRSSFKCECKCIDNKIDRCDCKCVDTGTSVDHCKCKKKYEFTSDHNNFIENGVGIKVASENNFSYGKDRYHTCKDTELDVKNIEMLSNVMVDFICNLPGDEKGTSEYFND